MDQDLLYRFAALFSGNERSHGVWDKKTGKMRTELVAASVDDYRMHLEGEQGVGVVPVKDDGNIMFAALDLDNHGDPVDLDLQKTAALAAEKKYPLVCCRSKSGGIHCYLFMKEPTPAYKVRSLLAAMAPEIGFPSAEIFPKQDKLLKDSLSGEMALGNWLNLCYFDSDDGVRRGMSGRGRLLTLGEFVDIAEAKRVSEADIDDMLSTGHSEAPPCIQRFYKEGVPGGYRNQALYNITIYLRRAKPDTYVDDAMDANNSVFDRPLPSVEAKRTIKSAGRRDYKYKCGEEPCKSYCDSRACVNKLYGITPDEEVEIRHGNELPPFTDLVKFDTDPPRWGFSMGGKEIQGVDTEELFNFNQLRKAVAGKLNTHVPNMSSRRWDAILQELFLTMKVVEVPKDASASGQAVARLVEYLSKAESRLSEGYDEAKEREKLTRGMPCIQFVAETKYGVFKMTDFVKHLKNTRSEDLKGANLYFALREHLGVETTRMRIGGKATTVWMVPMSNIHKTDPVPATFTAEF